jgi:hypothetical protein
MEEAERQLKYQHRVYCLGRSPVEGDPSKRARAHWEDPLGRSLRDTVAGQPRKINYS